MHRFKLTFFAVLILTGSCTQVKTDDPCRAALQVTLGNIDPRFDINPEILKSIIVEASAIWSDAVGWEIVKFNEKSGIPIHLIYGERQEEVDAERQLSSVIEEKRGQIISIERDLSWTRRDYQDKLDHYQRLHQNYESRVQQFNQMVEERNRRGQVSAQEISTIMDEKSMLDRTKTELDQLRMEAESIRMLNNRKTDEMNRLIIESNLMIARYNAQFDDSRTFHVGSYEQINGTRQINLYQFVSYTRLRTILTHEIGHALGLGHGNDPRSIMYPNLPSLITGELRLSDEDTGLIRARCWDGS